MNLNPTEKIMLGIVGVLVVIPGITYLVVEKSHEYTSEVGPKTYGNVSYSLSNSFGGKKTKKNKSRKLR